MKNLAGILNCQVLFFIAIVDQGVNVKDLVITVPVLPSSE